MMCVEDKERALLGDDCSITLSGDDEIWNIKMLGQAYSDHISE